MSIKNKRLQNSKKNKNSKLLLFFLGLVLNKLKNKEETDSVQTQTHTQREVKK
jgi:hypothetical protein